MPTVFNDIGRPSTSPCEGGWFRDCDMGDYSSWYRRATELDAQLAVVEDSGAPDQRARATAERLIYATFPEPGPFPIAGSLPMKPSRAKSIAAWCQKVADMLGREDSVVKLPPHIFQAPPVPSDVPVFFKGAAVGIAVGVLILGGGYLYAKSKDLV